MKCENKWKSLKRSYKEAVDENNKTGNGKKTSPLYEEFSQIYGTKESTRPSFSVESTSRSVTSPTPSTSSADNEI